MRTEVFFKECFEETWIRDELKKTVNKLDSTVRMNASFSAAEESKKDEYEELLGNFLEKCDPGSGQATTTAMTTVTATATAAAAAAAAAATGTEPTFLKKVYDGYNFQTGFDVDVRPYDAVNGKCLPGEVFELFAKMCKAVEVENPVAIVDEDATDDDEEGKNNITFSS